MVDGGIGMIRVFTISVLLSILAASTAAHQATDGSACHFGAEPEPGRTARVWHCHKQLNSQVIDGRSSRACKRAREGLAQQQQRPMSRQEKRVRRDIPVYCADTTKRGHAELCESLHQKVKYFEKTNRNSLKYWRNKVATACKVTVITPEQKRQNRRNAACERSKKELDRNLRAHRDPNIDASAGIRYWRAEVAKDCGP